MALSCLSTFVPFEEVFLFFLNVFIFHQRIIALQYCVCFCHTLGSLPASAPTPDSSVLSRTSSSASGVPGSGWPSSPSSGYSFLCPQALSVVTVQPTALLHLVISHKTREWVSQWKLLSRVRLFVTPWTIHFMAFSRPEYWSGQPFPSPEYLPNPGIEPRSPTLQADSLPAEPQGAKTWYTTIMPSDIAHEWLRKIQGRCP